MSDDQPLRVGSLFSGYLGLDKGIAAAFRALFGVDTKLAWVSDIDPGPCKLLAFRHPDVPNLGDITAIDWHTVPEVDLIGGGSPCQDISQAGRMAGMVTGTRSNLWTVMRDAIATLQPMFVVWENVGSALSTKAASASLPDHLDRAIDHHLAVAQETHHAPTANRHTRAAHRLMESRTRRVGVPYPKPALRALGRVLGDLASLGYDAVWHSNRAADIGAPHARRRVFLLAANTRGQAWLQRAGLCPGNPGRVGRGRPHHDGGETRPVAASLLPTPTTRDWKGHNQRRDTTCLTGALLPTPRATDGTKGGPNQRGTSGDLMLPSAVCQLLPTPTATQPGGTAANHLRKKPGRQQVTDLGMIVEQGLLETGGRLLPTPSVADAMGGHEKRGGTRGDELLLKGIATHQAWGPYQAAIARWETVNGPAPSPTKPGRNGNPKLNPAFAAWMMGAPAGWFTDVPGITDNEALKLAGNGVVPQQAAAAIVYCLHTFLKRDQP